MQKRWRYNIATHPRKRIGIFVFLMSCFFLQSSVTHKLLVPSFNAIEEIQNPNYSLFWTAAKQGSTEAVEALVYLAKQDQERLWLEKAASLNSLQAQLTLVKDSSGQDQIHWLKQAASNGHAHSQYLLSLRADSNQQKIHYLEQAGNNGHRLSIILLSRYYYDLGDAVNALKWLRLASKVDDSNIFRIGKMLWQQGNYEQATMAFKNASHNHSIANTYSDAIKNTQRQPLSKLAQKLQGLNENCAQQLQFVATSLDSLVQAISFRKQFKQDRQLSQLPICINKVVWLDENELSCEKMSERKVCDLTELASQSFTPSYTHLVLFLDEGKGYVQNGVMYLDEADAYTVFVHELAHFVGFVDEYSVPSTLASQYCFNSSAPNLLVSESKELQNEEIYLQWQIYNQRLRVEEGRSTGSENATNDDDSNTKIYKYDSVDLSPSLTCASLGKNSYKPSSKFTFMQYHDSGYIPSLYLLMWRQLLEKHHHSFAVSQAFKLQAQKMANYDAVDHWNKF